MEWVILVALAFGATFAVWILDACVDIAAIVCRRVWPRMRPRDIAYIGGGLYMFLMLGVPIIAVAWGFATGQLPVNP
jgi:hypothetical protein